MAYLDPPARILQCFVSKQTGIEAWPFSSGEDDPYWKHGRTPRDYRWRIDVEVTPQHHSSTTTRSPLRYTGMDVRVGDYIASAASGLTVKIIEVETKSDKIITCIVEDVFRYNTFRDSSGFGIGIFTVPTAGVIFTTNEEGLPILDPMPPMEIDSLFYPNLMSRFQNLEAESHFLLSQPGHSFEVNEFVSADKTINGFAKTDASHPMVVGRITHVASDEFFVSPVQNVTEFNALPGDVGDVLYADPSVPSGLTATENANPVLIKLRSATASMVRSTIANATTSPTTFVLNGVNHTVSTGTLQAIADSINSYSNTTGVSAQLVSPPNTISSTPSLYGSFGEALLDLRTGNPSAVFDGIGVTFTTHEDGNRLYGASYATATDMAHDINTAAGTTAAHVENGMLFYTRANGGAILIENSTPGSNGQVVAGINSGSGLPLTKTAIPGNILRLDAIDARAIDLADTTGSMLFDIGLYSVENGVKAAAMTIEDGGRQSKTSIVADITERNILVAIDGDQAHVLNKGDGEWGQYIYSGGWKLISSQDASENEGGHYSKTVLFSNSSVTLGEINGGSKIITVSVQVLTPFTSGAVLTVGRTGAQTELLEDRHADLGVTGTYLLTPQRTYASDTTIVAYLSGGPSAGIAVVSVTAQ